MNILQTYLPHKIPLKNAHFLPVFGLFLAFFGEKIPLFASNRNRFAHRDSLDSENKVVIEAQEERE
jgi:hypothetical protein